MPIKNCQGLYREGRIELETIPYGVRGAARCARNLTRSNAVSLHKGVSTKRKQLTCEHSLQPLPRTGKARRWTSMMTTTDSKPICKRGDVVLVLFPDSDLRTAKRRPALVVQRDNLQTGLPQVIVAMITSNLNRANHPCRVTIAHSTPQGLEVGFSGDSVIITDNLATVFEPAIDRVIGALSMVDVNAALKYTLGLG